jgi:hypothetical protein
LTVQVRYSEDSDRMLRTFICEDNKGQFKKGMLQEYLDRAVIEYVVAHKGHSTHTQFIKENETKELKERIAKWLIGEPYKYDPSLQTVLESHLKEAIRVIDGVRDERSVKSRIDALLAIGVKRISHTRPRQYSFEPEIWQEQGI